MELLFVRRVNGRLFSQKSFIADGGMGTKYALNLIKILMAEIDTAFLI